MKPFRFIGIYLLGIIAGLILGTLLMMGGKVDDLAIH
jgi:hypothetical protein